MFRIISAVEQHCAVQEGDDPGTGADGVGSMRVVAMATARTKDNSFLMGFFLLNVEWGRGRIGLCISIMRAFPRGRESKGNIVKI